jgi:hypothetical protein
MKMRKRLKSQRGSNFVPATYRGPMPGDYPVGSVESRAAARAILMACAEEQREQEEAALVDLTPSEQASIRAEIEDVDKPLVRIWMIYFFRMSRERAKVYEMDLPLHTPEEIRHNRAVFKEIDRMTGGQASSLRDGDHAEWNRWKAIVEEELRAKKQ